MDAGLGHVPSKKTVRVPQTEVRAVDYSRNYVFKIIKQKNFHGKKIQIITGSVTV